MIFFLISQELNFAVFVKNCEKLQNFLLYGFCTNFSHSKNCTSHACQLNCFVIKQHKNTETGILDSLWHLELRMTTTGDKKWKWYSFEFKAWQHFLFRRHFFYFLLSSVLLNGIVNLLYNSSKDDEFSHLANQCFR